MKTQKIKAQFSKFKRTVENEMGRINWRKVGVFTIAALLVLATAGFFGPKAQIIALGIIELSRHQIA